MSIKAQIKTIVSQSLKKIYIVTNSHGNVQNIIQDALNNTI